MRYFFFMLIVFFLMPGCCGYEDKVVEFGSLKLGEPAPYKPGDPTAGPFVKIPLSEFYIYVVENGLSTMCVFGECGPNGEIVECLGGWLSGDDQAEDIEAFGLDEKLVSQGKSSVVVVADQDSKIVGIYPNYTMQNIPEVLKRHVDLVDFGIFGSKCSSLNKVHEEYYGR
jgi:hypothetical protein